MAYGEMRRSKERKLTHILLWAVEPHERKKITSFELRQQINTISLQIGKTATEMRVILHQVYEAENIRKCVYDWLKHFWESEKITKTPCNFYRLSTILTWSGACDFFSLSSPQDSRKADVLQIYRHPTTFDISALSIPKMTLADFITDV